MSGCDWEELRLSPSATAALAATRKERRARHAESATPRARFIKGPIPVAWLATAASLPLTKAVQTGLAIWYLAGLRKSKTVVLSNLMLASFNVGPQAKYRCLKALEDAGLISVEYRPQKNPRVTLHPDGGGPVDLPDHEKD
jgi:hypothetical protein